jgi:hypothetical protein
VYINVSEGHTASKFRQEVGRARILMGYIGENTRIGPGSAGRLDIRAAGEVGELKPGPGQKQL